MPKKDEQGTEDKPRGNCLVEYPPSKENGDERVTVNPVGSDNSTKPADNQVPHKKTEQGGYYT
jgi:hypothetical protein